MSFGLLTRAFACTVFSVIVLVCASEAQPSHTLSKPYEVLQEEGLRAQFLLISESNFFEQWEDGSIKEINVDAAYGYREPLYPVLLVSSEATDSTGQTNVTYTVTVEHVEHDTTLINTGEMVALRGGPASGYRLASERIELGFSKSDTRGYHRVRFVVHDKVQNVKLRSTLVFGFFPGAPKMSPLPPTN